MHKQVDFIAECNEKMKELLAKPQGGRVELNIEEDTLTGQLVYMGEKLALGSADPEGLVAFSEIIAVSEDIFISTHDRCSKFQFIFCLYDKVFVEDHSEQIAEIKEKIRVHRAETLRLRRMLSNKD